MARDRSAGMLCRRCTHRDRSLDREVVEVNTGRALWVGCNIDLVPMCLDPGEWECKGFERAPVDYGDGYMGAGN